MKTINRRRFLRYGAEASLTFGFVGFVHASSQTRAYVRPPGSVPPKEFTSQCMRCSICVEVCPTDAIRLIDLSLDFKNISTPIIDPQFGGCTHWEKECLKCVKACPTGALNEKRVEKKQKLGHVWLKSDPCVNCMICFDKCPVEGAILFPNPNGTPFTKKTDIPVANRTVNSQHKPYIDQNKCTGCGLCVHYCPEKIMYLEPESKGA